MVDDGRHEGRWGWVVLHEKEKDKVSLCSGVSIWWGPAVYYPCFMKRNNEKDRFMFPW